MQKRSLYSLMLGLSVAGAAWLFLDHSLSGGATLCLFKSATDLPCPSCGTTRSLVVLLQGDLFQALSINPLGIVAAVGLIVVPLWISIDLFRSQDSFYRAFRSIENFLRSNRLAAAAGIVIIAGNWLWNIAKGL
jgi:hypothetical protein